MARSGSNKRRRQVTLKARFDDAEAALVQERADRAGVSVAAYIRYATLDQTPLRASRRPPLDRVAAAQLLGQLGRVTAELHESALVGGSENALLIEAVQRDLADMRAVLFEALGREP